MPKNFGAPWGRYNREVASDNKTPWTSLAGGVAVITGGASGIGLALAKEAAGKGIPTPPPPVQKWLEDPKVVLGTRFEEMSKMGIKVVAGDELEVQDVQSTGSVAKWTCSPSWTMYLDDNAAFSARPKDLSGKPSQIE